MTEYLLTNQLDEHTMRNNPKHGRGRQKRIYQKELLETILSRRNMH